MPLLPVQKDWARSLAKAGRIGLHYLRERTRESPAFMALTAMVHQDPGGVYEFLQEAKDDIVEIMEMEGYRTFYESLTPGRIKAICGHRRLSKGASELCSTAIKGIAKCLAEVCTPKEKCEVRGGLERLFSCLEKVEGTAHGKRRRVVPKPPAKTRELVREYLGDDEAVAVDRHVMKTLMLLFDYVPSIIGPKGRVRGALIDEVRDARNDYRKLYFGREAESYATIASYERPKAVEYVRRIAREAGVKPAELQVGMWLWSKCLSEGMPKTVPHNRKAP